MMMKRKQDHYRAGVNEHLDDAQEVGVQHHEERREPDEGNDEAEGAGDRVAIEHHGAGEPEHQRRKYPEEDRGHGREMRNANAECGMRRR